MRSVELNTRESVRPLAKSHGIGEKYDVRRHMLGFVGGLRRWA
jgi:hypothetical protein